MSGAVQGSSTRVVLDRTTIELLEGAPSMVVATSSEDRMPDLVQGIGCRVLADGSVVLVVAREQAENVLENLEAGRPIAVTFSRPSTVRTVQLKSDRATVRPTKRGDLETVRRYRAAFAAELDAIGYGAAYAEAITDPGASVLVAITFFPTAVFEQTPGPNAGQKLSEQKP